MTDTHTDFLHQLRQLLGTSAVRTGEDALAYHTDERNRYHLPPLAAVFPANPDEIAQVVRLCAAQTPPIALIAQGGNTGLVGGCAVLPNVPSILLNLARLNAIIAVDPLNRTLTAQAGATLVQVQASAQAHGLLFPLSLASEQSATVGGILATNAGGTQVLRYGNTRDLCLGLEVILADGQVLSVLNALRKNNTGYDLKHLFIGAEGTLGIITAAVFKLYPQPAERATALIGAVNLPQLMTAFARLSAHCDAQLTAFEMISPATLQLVCTHLACPHPFANSPHHHTALVEVSYPSQPDDTVQQTLLQLLNEGILSEVLIAQSLAQAEHFWRIREQISAAQKAQGKNIKHDISVPISAIVEFVADTAAALSTAYPGIQPMVFGHIGDGNLHYNVSAGTAFVDPAELMAHETAINDIVYAQVVRFGGSISAEHGIGLLKRERMAQVKSAAELGLMRAIKNTLDPLNIFNPNKILPTNN